MGTRGKRIASVVLAASLVWACTLFNPLDAYGPPVDRSEDAATTADVTSSLDAGTGCDKARWPDRPGNEDDGGPVAAELVFAIDTLTFAQRGDGGAAEATTGYDLDDSCTCPGPPSCTGPVGVREACDRERGIDTGGTDLLGTFVQIAGSLLDFNEDYESGQRGLLFRVRNYNGGLDDPEVEVSVFVSGGNEGAEAGTPKVPTRDGNDAWTVEPAWLFGGSAPPYLPNYASTKAYVAGGTLVVVLEAALRLSDVELKLSGLVITARIVRDAQGSFRLSDGRIAGRWATHDILTGFDVIRDKSVPKEDGGYVGLCGDNKRYQDLKTKICAGVDISSDPLKDNTPSPCDALAITLVFTASPAKLGAVYAAPARERLCGQTWQDGCDR